MRKFIIEREIPGIGNRTADELKQAAQTSNRALAALGPGIQWQHSYVAGNKTFCVYLADNEELIRKHANGSGFPANAITEIVTVFDPSTGHDPSAS